MSFQPGANLYTQGFGSRAENVEVPHIDIRSPTVGDVNYPVGKKWINRAANSTFTLTSFTSFNGAVIADWVSEGGGASFPITPYVVGPAGKAGYQTIQSAINAANAAGGGMVFVQQGTYTENLTCYNNTQVIGAVGWSDAGEGVTIIGVHTPPLTGSFSFERILFQSATDLFHSVGFGSSTLIIGDSLVQLTNGYTFNLLNWSGSFVVYDLGDVSTNNGVVNNAGGASCFFVSATMGAGVGNTMTTTGSVEIQELDLNCPWSAGAGSVITSDLNDFAHTVTCAGNATGEFSFCKFSTGSTAAFVMSSSAAVSLVSCIINSSNAPSINGAGAGILSLGNITFVNNAALAGTLTTAWLASKTGALTTSGNITFPIAGNKLLSTNVGTVAAAGANSFGSVVLVGGTVTVSTTAVTSASLVVLWRQSVGATGNAALGILSLGAIVNGTSFVINAWETTSATTLQATDVSVVGYMIIN